MNNLHSKHSITLCLLLCITSGAVAADSDTNAPPPFSKISGRRVQQDISKWDLNHNGRLDPDELEAFRRDQVYAQHQKSQADAQAAAERRRESARPKPPTAAVVIKKYDANQNGVLDPDELEKYRQDIEKIKAEKLHIYPLTNSFAFAPRHAKTNSPAGTNAPAAPKAP